jgi:hypothetical protein
MKVTQIRLAGSATTRPAAADGLGGSLNVFRSSPVVGQAAAGLVAHLLYGKNADPTALEAGVERVRGGESLLAEGSLEVETPRGRYVLRRHRDGSQLGRLTVASADGSAADGGVIRSLLGDLSPRMLGELLAHDFSQKPSVRRLLDGRFAGDYLAALRDPQTTATDELRRCETHSPSERPSLRRPAVDHLLARRDEIARRIEDFYSARRRDGEAAGRELAAIEAELAEVGKRREALNVSLAAVEAELAEATSRLRYLTLSAAAAATPPALDEQSRLELEAIEAEIARCRQILNEGQQREAALRRELAQSKSDGASPVDPLVEQRSTVTVLERLIGDLDAETSQLARAHEPGRCVGLDAHARLQPLARMLREQVYVLCGQVAEQERASRRRRALAESRQLARSQSDLSEQLEHLLERRQSLLHASAVSRRTATLLPATPAAGHCRCEQHDRFVRRQVDPGVGGLPNQETTLRNRVAELEVRRDQLRSGEETLRRENGGLEARRRQLQLDRGGAGDRKTLDQLQDSLDQLERDIQIRLSEGDGRALSETHGVWKASDALAQLSGGRLAQIRLSGAGRTATVIERGGGVLQLEQLSPQQHDQLYLALVLALASSLAGRGVDLPLVLEEPFARQDAEAAAAMAGTLAEYAREGRQLLIFTSRDEALARFESLGVATRDFGRTILSGEMAAPSPPVAASAEIRVVRETTDARAPRLRIAGRWSADEEQDAYYLSPQSTLDDFPVLGNDTARIFAALGVDTVQALLAADAAEVAHRLRRPGLTADAVKLWQSHMSLMCYIPGVSLGDAQVLAANDVGSPEAFYAIDVRLLAESIDRFLNTERGRRFAAASTRFTRERLAELQKVARQQRDRWHQASRSFAWVERQPARDESTGETGFVKRIHTGEDDRRSPQRRKASRPKSRRGITASKAPAASSLQFHLSRRSPVADSPSIGAKTALRLADVGIRSVADLINANPESTAAELAVSAITSETIARWQREARLMCRVPGLRCGGAQVLVACGFAEPESIAGTSADQLFDAVRKFCRTAPGRRLLRNSPAPNRQRVAQWVEQASHTRPLEAA